MKLISFPGLLPVLLAPKLVQSWTLVWSNATNGASIERGDNPKTCTGIYQTEGQDFSFDPEGLWCLDFWAKNTCENRVGWSCDGKVWKKSASTNISGYDVYAMPPASVSAYGLATSSTPAASSSTPNATGPNAGAAETTAATDANQGDDGDNSLSGGAIAGIVIGVVAGVAILAVLGFLWGRRRNTKAGVGNGPGAPEMTNSGSTPGAATTGNIPSPDSPQGPSPGGFVASGYLQRPTGSPGGPPPAFAGYASPAKQPIMKSQTQVYGSEQGYFPVSQPVHQPPTGVKMAELAGSSRQAELSNTNQVMELDG